MSQRYLQEPEQLYSEFNSCEQGLTSQQAVQNIEKFGSNKISEGKKKSPLIIFLEQFKDFPAPRLGYDEITKKYADAQTVREELTKLKAQWPEFKARLQGQMYSFATMQDLFRRAGAPYDPSHIGVTRQQLKDMFPIVQLMRFRYNVLDLAKRGGFYDAIVEPVFAEGGAWEI